MHIFGQDNTDKNCESECCGKCESHTLDNNTIYSPGTIVKSLLTGENVMVLKFETDPEPSYVVRNKNYQMVQMFVFELENK